MTNAPEIRWRLRHEGKIVGYERHVGSRIWSSKDGLWWRGQRLTHSEKDRCLGIKDLNNQWIYEHDVVTTKDFEGAWLVVHFARQWALVREDNMVSPPTTDRQLKRIGFKFPEN
jgi:hypothetical protein